MDIHLTNTLSRKKELFKPIKKGEVGIYQCGPTVYWTQHIGNMRAVVMTDIFHRTFKYLDHEVNFVRNITDVGHLTGDNLGDANTGVDRMDKTSKLENKSPKEIAEKYTKQYLNDSKLLNALPASKSPKATEHISEIIKMVEELMDKGFAYPTPLAVYFDTSKAKDYTRLSGQKIEEQLKGTGHGNVYDSDRKNPNDFALWIFKTGDHKNALQTWQSPFISSNVENGEGFPGWHIECSAMSKKYLGDTFDIHVGGIEHIPVHHTNEIAQSENANGKDFVHYWLHYEHLLVDGKKMAKSEGTAYNLSEVIDKGFTPMDLRYFFLQAHYKSKQNFTWEALKSSRTAQDRLVTSLSEISDNGEIDESLKSELTKMVSDDFNTPQALAQIWEALKSDTYKKEDVRATILDFDKILGLNLKEQIDNLESKTSDIPEEITRLSNERENERRNGNYAEADLIREKIEELGFIITDKDGETVITRK